MAPSPSQPKTLDWFRERVVSRYVSAFGNLARPSPGVDVTVPEERLRENFIPRSSEDSALNAFAQLGALRLNASRALISLIDTTSQYVLAEATRSLSTQSDHRHDDHDGLWIGSVVLPRGSGICEVVLNSDTIPSPDDSDDALQQSHADQEIVTIQDLRDDARFSARSYVAGGPKMRFYAGAPLRNLDGTKIGAYCVFDPTPRAGLSPAQKLFMVDMAKTIMKHLEGVRMQLELQRRDRLVVGLESFVQGLTEIPKAHPGIANRSHAPDLQPHNPDLEALLTGAQVAQVSHGSDISSARSMAMWEMALPSGCKTMFSRAANIIREAGGYDGVSFFYVSSASSTGRSSRRQTAGSELGNSPSRHSSTSSTGSDSSQTGANAMPPVDSSRAGTPTESQSGNEDSNIDALSPVLGFSLSKADEKTRVSDQLRFPRFRLRDLQKLMGTRPSGRVYFLDRQGTAMPGDTSSSGSGAEAPDSNTSPPQNSKKRALQVKSLLKINPLARTFICLPLWDFHRERWFAFCICWILTPTRDPVVDRDLSFLRIFCNSITNSLSHLDTLEADVSKTSFIASISHELRSPLHGVLGATNFLYGSNLNRFQLEMVDSISSSGRTLLDTLEHVMDFTKINNFAKAHSGSSTTSKRRDIRSSTLTSSVDLTQLVEEVVEAVFMGFTFQHDFVHSDAELVSGRPPVLTPPSDSIHQRRSLYKRGHVRLALDIASLEGNAVELQPGAWRRIIMNIVGNALKYTDQGLITVSLQITDMDLSELDRDDPDPKTTSITLTVKDTGIGMSNEFLQNHLFKPFTQENSFASGTGLGLSIVDQIVKSLEGYVEVSSAKGFGTTMTVRANARQGQRQLFDAEESHPASLARHFKTLRVTVLEDTSSKGSKDNPESFVKAEDTFGNILLSNLQNWYGIESSVQDSWSPASTDLLICLEPSFRLIESIKVKSREQGSDPPPVLIIAHDALEMAVLRQDARVQSPDITIEITHQPLGPRKLSKALYQTLLLSGLVRNREAEDGETPMDRSFNHSTQPQSAALRGLALRQLRPKTPVSAIEDRNDSDSTPAASRDLDTILCVDDNVLNLRLLTTFINRNGFSSVDVSNGEEALTLYKASNGSFKCVLMDISMPIMDGMTATRHIRTFEKEQSLRRVPIVALTGLASATARSEAIESGMDHFLTKPLNFSQLKEIVTGFPATPAAT